MGKEILKLKDSINIDETLIYELGIWEDLYKLKVMGEHGTLSEAHKRLISQLRERVDLYKKSLHELYLYATGRISRLMLKIEQSSYSEDVINVIKGRIEEIQEWVLRVKKALIIKHIKLKETDVVRDYGEFNINYYLGYTY